MGWKVRLLLSVLGIAALTFVEIFSYRFFEGVHNAFRDKTDIEIED